MKHSTDVRPVGAQFSQHTNVEGTSHDCTDADAFGLFVERAKSGEEIDSLASELWGRLFPDEKLSLLTGNLNFWTGMRALIAGAYRQHTYDMATVERLGIPGLLFADGPRGCVLGTATSFPVPMARGATWDIDLEERIGKAMGREVRERGGNLFGGICINLPRHPAWGRSQETYSDQPLLLGAFGAALTRGVQQNVMACMKHYAVNSMENARFEVDVRVDEATLHEDYLPHFKRVVESGVSSVMSSYNAVNGEWAGHNTYLLDTVLRQDWGFSGIVVPDWVWGIRDGVASLKAGVDVETPFRQVRDERLAAALESLPSDWEYVERAGLRVLRTLIDHYASRIAEEPHGSITSSEHVALARETATRSAVLLKNETVAGNPALPIIPSSVQSLAVVGRLANTANTGDEGSSRVAAPYVVTALEGIRAAFPDAETVTSADSTAAAAVAAAQSADAAVVVVGYTTEDEGEFVQGSVATRPEFLKQYPTPRSESELSDRETVLDAMSGSKSIIGRDAIGGDRADLHLLPEDVEMIQAVAAANPRTIVVVVGASAVLMEEWIDSVPAVIMGWYSGMEGGNGLADVISGDRNPSGRLPYPIPADATDLPYFDMNATHIEYDRWYGQRLLQKRGVDALFPLGFGLSFTTYDLVEGTVFDIDREAATAKAFVRVRNSGAIAGSHVVQVYGTRLDGSRMGERELLGFGVVDVEPQAVSELQVNLDLNSLGRWSPENREIHVAEGAVRIEISSHWGDPESLVMEVEI